MQAGATARYVYIGVAASRGTPQALEQIALAHAGRPGALDLLLLVDHAGHVESPGCGPSADPARLPGQTVAIV